VAPIGIFAEIADPSTGPEQMSVFTTNYHLKTAEALGLNIPSALLTRAGERADRMAIQWFRARSLLQSLRAVVVTGFGCRPHHCARKHGRGPPDR